MGEPLNHIHQDTKSPQLIAVGKRTLKTTTNCCLTFSRADEDPSFITSKHLRRYSGGDPIDTESSDESDDEGRRDDSSDDDEENDRTTSNARQSWCTIS